MMDDRICLVGSKDFFYIALEDRLIRLGANIVSEFDDATIKIGFDTNLEVDLLIIPSDTKNINVSKLVIRTHDLLIPDGNSKWSPNDIYLLMDNLKSGLNDFDNKLDVHYWVHIRDAVEAISMIVLSDEFANIKGNLDICGRRAWSNKDVLEELDMLWTRYKNSINYTHTIESLSKIPKTVNENMNKIKQRPNLVPLNNEIIRAGGDGWHPLTPLRTGLMELLAQNL